MDYDDNDFQSQNFQLIGEDDTFLPGLRPFALPKFDIDDQLQVHLAEKEVVFGTLSRRHSWIEDFTPGSSAIDFSSSVAESCSISITNNVWSEATSSESVEMLLKSVGDDEMAHNRDGTKDGGAHDRLNRMDCPDDPLLWQDKSNSSQIVEIIDPRVLQNPCHTSRSGLTEDARMKHSQFENISHPAKGEEHGLLPERMLKEKINSDVDDNAASSSNDTSNNHLTVDDYLEAVHNENPLENSSKIENDCDNYTWHSTKGRIACSDSVTCESKKNEPSRISIDNGGVECDIVELQKIHMGHPYDLQPINQQEAENLIASVDVQLNQITERCVADSDVCNLKGSFFLEPTLGDIKLLNKGSKDSLLSESSDGLLEAITCQVKTSSRENDTGICRKEVSTLEEEDARNILIHAPEESKGVVTMLSHRGEHFEDLGHCQNKCHSRNTYSELENPLLISSSELIECEEQELAYAREVTRQNQDSEGRSSPDRNDCGTDSSKPICAEQCKPEKHRIEVEKKDANDLMTDLVNFTCQTTEQAVLLECAEDEDTKDITCPLTITLDASTDVVSKEFSSALLDETELTSSIDDRKTVDMAGGCNVVSASSLADSNVVKDKLECASSRGQSTDQLAYSDSLSASNLVQEKIGDDDATKDARCSSLECLTISQIHCEDTPSVSMVVGHEEVAASRVSASGSINSCRKNVETTVKSSLADVENKLAVQSSDDPLHHDTNILDESVISGINEKSHQVGSGGGDLNCSEPVCGSPTIISSRECCQNETGGGSQVLPDHQHAASDDHAECHTTHDVEAKSTVQGFEKEVSTSEDDKSFSFKVAPLDLSERDSGIDWKPFSSAKASDIDVVPKEKAKEHHDPRDGNLCGTTMIASEDMGKQNSCHATEKTSSATGAAEVVLQEQTTESDRGPSSPLPGDDITTTSNIQLEETQKTCSPAVETTGLPDLNTSVCAAVSVRKSFTDLQHVQLRAQIFVYGSLIQGVPPGEAFMISAFGNSDGGRTAWERAWRTAVERFQSQNSPWSNCSRDTEHELRATPVKSKFLNFPVGLSGGKFLQSASPTVPLLSSPWGTVSRGTLPSSMARGTQLDFIQAISPYTYQSLQTRQSTSNVATRFTQSPLPAATCAVSPQRPGSDVATPSLVVTTSETYNASNVQLSLPSTMLPGPGSPSVSAALIIQDEAQKIADSTNKNATTTQKQRKRRKGSVGQEQGSLIQATQLKIKPSSPTVVSAKNSPISTGFTLTASSSNKMELTSSTCQIMSPSNYQVICGRGAAQKVIFSEEMCSKIEQSRLQAADAAAHADAAIKYSQGIWSQLAEQKKSGLLSEVEERLASAAVAAAAAASVAKAAAEAAKVASEAASHAKEMADDAINSGKVVSSQQISETGQLGSCGVISATREVARKRVELSSAATKRAKNLDMILKAAELAAEAVAQAGAVIAMGDPLPVTVDELLEAGPDGYWKARDSKIEKPLTNNLSDVVVADDSDRLTKHDERSTNYELQKTSKEASIPNQSIRTENDGEDVPNTTQIDRPGVDPSSSDIKGSIQKGSLVEVVADDAGLGGIWFSASVLDIKDNRAYVCYDNRLSSEGFGQHTEWIPLECEADKAPRLRVAHPITTVKLDGTRKRRREAIGGFSWAIGDHVDAMIRDGWWEGIITGKGGGDEPEFSVHFPAKGNTSVVKAWCLRPTLVWKDAQWIQWSRPLETNAQSHEGDSPYKKRQRLGQLGSVVDPGIDGHRAVGPAGYTNINISGDSEELKTLNLSLREQTFNIGKNVIGQKNARAHAKRTGLQKEGSGVVFGVPRPGKKRKFMDVSKHYDADKLDKPTGGDASVKIAKYLMPQTFRAGGAASKVDLSGKQENERKSRAHKPVRTQNIQGRSTKEKEISSTIAAPASNSGDISQVSVSDLRATFSSDDRNVEKNAPYAVPLINNIRTEDSSLVKSRKQPATGSLTSKKNFAEPDLGARGKSTTVVNKLAMNERKASEDLGKTNPDASEPRRSSRRIQPTSRLLEGLQSSLILSKISSDKSARGPQRGPSSSRGKTHG